ncbi:MAG: BrnT family toxin [Thermodesulfobacteriota bacterium]
MEALEVLFDPHYRAEDAGVQEEQRHAVIGYSDRATLLHVVVADAGEAAWRIISARPATRREKLRYEEETDLG